LIGWALLGSSVEMITTIALVKPIRRQAWRLGMTAANTDQLGRFSRDGWSLGEFAHLKLASA